MSNRLSGAFLVACGVLAAGAAAAQDANSNPDSAAASGASPAMLQEVVVTARHRKENLQNVPLTDTAVTARAIESWDVTNLEDLNSFVPNMKISQDRATGSTINVYIRGVGQSDPLWGFDPAVGVYIDDVYLARPQAALLDVLDVQRLEVLSGPQGTLYGKNTIAGAIKYVTRDIVGPTWLTASVTGGNYGQHDFKLDFSAPLVENHVYFGVSLGELRRGGYGEVVAQPGQAPSTQNFIGQAVSNKDVFAGRANLTLLWGASSKLVLVADDILDNSNAAGGHRLTNYLVPQLSNPFDMYDDMPVGKDYFHRSGFSGTYTQKLTDNLDLKLIGAYYEGRGQQFINFSETDQNLFEVPAHLPGPAGLGRGSSDLHQQPGEGRRGHLLHEQHRLRRLQRLDRHAQPSRGAGIRPLHHRARAGLRAHQELRRLRRYLMEADGQARPRHRHPVERGPQNRARLPGRLRQLRPRPALPGPDRSSTRPRCRPASSPIPAW